MSDRMNAMGTVTISDLEVLTRIGVPEAERKNEQKVLITIECDTEIHGNDEVTIDYEKIVNAIRDISKLERKTLEKFCQDIAEMLSKQFACQKYRIEIKKFILPGVRYTSFRLES